MPRWSPFEPYFWSLVSKKSGDDCWEWLGNIDSKGYGRVHRGKKRERAHRVAYELNSHSPIPNGLYACHHCDNKKCVRPSHIFLGTHSDNMRDCTEKGRNTLISTPSMWRVGDDHWTRQNTKKTKIELKKISERRKLEWKSGRRIAIRDKRGRIMGTRMVP